MIFKKKIKEVENTIPNEVDIILYSVKYCPICEKLRNFLKGHNIPFEAIEISGNEELFKMLIKEYGHCSVPIIKTPERVIFGIDYKALEEVLGIKISIKEDINIIQKYLGYSKEMY